MGSGRRRAASAFFTLSEFSNEVRLAPYRGKASRIAVWIDLSHCIAMEIAARIMRMLNPVCIPRERFERKGNFAIRERPPSMMASMGMAVPAEYAIATTMEDPSTLFDTARLITDAMMGPTQGRPDEPETEPDRNP